MPHAVTTPNPTVLPEEQWQAARENHVRRLGPFVAEQLARRSRGQKHPVWDFLFEYYSFKPSHLLKWSPGLGVVLQGGAAREFLQQPDYHEVEQGVTLSPAQFSSRRHEALQRTLTLLRAMAERPPFFGCYGLHEWAMVYQTQEVRHGQVGLRLPHAEVDEIVEGATVRCTHYDAFRFFTPEARPLNVLQPDPEDRADQEQRGCIHANMDLYKWAYKFWPFVRSETLGDAFLLAREARETDMRASPYDLQAAGFAPIKIETQEGKAEYVVAQKALAARAQPIRLALISDLQQLRDQVEHQD